MKKFVLPFGKGSQVIALPEEHVLYDIHGNAGAVIKDIQAETLRALRRPLDSKPLRELVHPGEKIAVVVSDITRLPQGCLGSDVKPRGTCLNAGEQRQRIVFAAEGKVEESADGVFQFECFFDG